MTRTKPPEQRRAELLAAGRELFLAKGIATTSLDDITHQAGVSKGLFYLYFRSKEDLILALQEQFSCQFAERMRAAADGPADWAAKLDACAQASFECYRDLHDLHEVLFHHGHPAHHSHPAHHDDPVHHDDGDDASHSDLGSHEPSHAVATQVFQELFAAGTVAGAFDVADPEATAALCYASMHAFDCGFRGRHGPDDARLIRAAQQLLRRAAGVTAERAAGIPADSVSTTGNVSITVGAVAGDVGDAPPPAAPDAPA
jgi:TetR/AcrR family transcriptional regulator, transcriptional repressor for nem operon